MSQGNRKEGTNSLPSIHLPVLPQTDAEALKRLALDPRDAEALIALYESHRQEFNKTTARWFGRNTDFQRRALNEILVAVGQRASSYDPELAEAADWIGTCADSEARRLRSTVERKSPGRRAAKQRGVH